MSYCGYHAKLYGDNRTNVQGSRDGHGQDAADICCEAHGPRITNVPSNQAIDALLPVAATALPIAFRKINRARGHMVVYPIQPLHYQGGGLGGLDFRRLWLVYTHFRPLEIG